MDILKINNDFSYLITQNQQVKTIIWSVLRFRKKNYFYNRAYKAKKWDGYIDFFNQSTGKFLTGLLPEVKLALTNLKINYQINDQREIIVSIQENINTNFLQQWQPKNNKSIILEDYQVDFTNQALKHGRGIIKSPTGSGKGLLPTTILKCLPVLPTLIICNRKDIINQNYEEIINWGFTDVGRFTDHYHETGTIICATVQSLHHLEKLLPKIRILIVDEVHKMMSSQCIKYYKKLVNCYVRIGLSATPFKFQKKRKDKVIEGDNVHKYALKGYFGPVFKTNITASGELPISYLQGINRLSKTNCTFYYIDEPKIPYDIFLDAVTNGIANSWYFHGVVSRLVKQLKKRTLIIVERIAHGDALHQLIPNSLWIQGKDDEKTRKEVIEQLQSSQTDVVAIATQGIFNTGINVYINNLINGAGGKAEHEIIQRIGRGLRPADDKEILNYIDFYFRINEYLEKHSKNRIATLKSEGHEVVVKEINF